MKNEKLMRSLEHIDDKYIEEAAPERAKTIKSLKLGRNLAIIAACICCMLTVLGVWMFMPIKNQIPSVEQYKNSEYYAIIEKLNVAFYKDEPKYKNNFDKYIWSNRHNWEIFSFFSVKKDAAVGIPEYSGTSDRYEEITDNQVDGVIEADKIKRSDKYIFHLNRGSLRVYSIEQENSKIVGKYEFLDAQVEATEFYLSTDCKTATVIREEVSYKDGRSVKLLSLDVSDPKNISVKKTVTIKGKYLSSRYVDGKLLLISRFYANGVDFDEPYTFIPYINEDGENKLISPSCITIPEEITNMSYTFIVEFDANTLTADDTAAYLSYTDNVYVTTENMYLTNEYKKTTTVDNVVETRYKSDITCIKFNGEKFEHLGTISVDGHINDQYSMDEYNGILRIATTTWCGKESTNDNIRVAYADTGRNAALYCIDFAKKEVVSSVVNFAPWGEEVKSARFDKEKAYICTAVEFTDPVFFFDLSDINNITYKETMEISGFSTSLVNFGDGYLLGIGYENSRDIKIEIYKEGNNKVDSVCNYIEQYANITGDYKSYYINREEKLVGLSIVGENQYKLFKFDGYDLVILLSERLDGNFLYHRGILIDDYFYMFGENDFVVKKLCE